MLNKNNLTEKKINAKGEIINKYTAVIKQDSDWWIGWVEEVTGVNCQEKTRKELLNTLKLTLGEILELNNSYSHACPSVALA